MSPGSQASAVIDPPGVSTAVSDLAERLVSSHPLQFTLATSAKDRNAAFKLRHSAIVERGWSAGTVDGHDRDVYDQCSLIVVGWHSGDAVASGRLVLPPGPLPTEVECGIVVAPAGRVVDVGRMVVASSHQAWHRGAFVALLAALYLEMRRQGYDVATGLMARDARALVRLLGLRLDVLGPEVITQGAARAPVRFACDDADEMLLQRWSVPE